MAASPNLPHFHAALPDGEVAPEGFAIRLPSAQLGDLIQINCMNRVRGAFRVSSEGREGHLYFAGGQLIHADFGAVTGLDAVVQMLSWKSGSIEPCVAPWPRESTIDMGADALLLCAAQRLDELPLRPSGIPEDLTTKVVRRVAVGADAREVPGDEPSAADESGAPPPEADPSGARTSVVPSREQLSQLQVAQLGFDGVVRQLKGGATLDLADTAFFSLRMATTIGETLGVGACHAVLLEGAEDAVVVIKGRSIVATRGGKPELGFVLERVRLA